MGTSGTAVFFAGGTVIVSMAALALTGVGFLTSIGLATSIIVLFAMATALTLLPALLSLLGDRIDAGRVIGRRRSAEAGRGHRVVAAGSPDLRPGRGRTSSEHQSCSLALAAPALSLKTGFPNAGDNPTSATERRAYDLLADGFGPGFNAPLLVVADLNGTGLAAGDIPALAAADRCRPGRRGGRRAAGQPRTATPSCCPRSPPPGRPTRPPRRRSSGSGPSPRTACA